MMATPHTALHSRLAICFSKGLQCALLLRELLAAADHIQKCARCKVGRSLLWPHKIVTGRSHLRASALSPHVLSKEPVSM